jgi:hypothetical protein
VDLPLVHRHRDDGTGRVALLLPVELPWRAFANAGCLGSDIVLVLAEIEDGLMVYGNAAHGLSSSVLSNGDRSSMACMDQSCASNLFSLSVSIN